MSGFRIAEPINDALGVKSAVSVPCGGPFGLQFAAVAKSVPVLFQVYVACANADGDKVAKPSRANGRQQANRSMGDRKNLWGLGKAGQF
jgi:hypothetical protein